MKQQLLFSSKTCVWGVTLLVLALSAKGDVASVVNQVSQTSYQGYLDNSLYTRLGQDRGTPASGHMYFGAQHDPARTNIQSALKSFGLAVTLDWFDPGFGPGNGFTYVNVVGQLTGTTRSNEVYLVGAHYDSVSNPGADDNASGIAGVIEAARVLSQYRFEATLRFVAFDGEETEIYGSKRYAAAAKNAGENIVGMVALDMIANKRLGDGVEVVGIGTDLIVSNMLQCVVTYGGLTGIFGGQDPNSDHYSFAEKGFQACLLFERDGGNNPHYHQATDSIDTPDYIDYAYATKITRSAVGYLATQAGLVGLRPLAAPLVAQASSITETNFNAVWNPVDRATNYLLQVATSGNFDPTNLVSGFDRLSVGAATNWLVANLLPGIDYFYRVQAQGSQVSSDFSTPATVRTLKSPRINPSDNSWTVLIYAHGDHNLSPNLMYDLNEMEQTGSSDGFNIVVQADFNASQTVPGLPIGLAAGITRFLVQKDADPFNFTTPVIERLPESNNMDDPQVLINFITWSVQKYPARRYGLVLWDHGGQYQGFGGDTQDGTIPGGNLSTAQIRQAVTTAMQANGIAKLDFMAYDTCLMGGVEVLPDAAPLTDVFIACPELDFGDGWDYAASLGYLKANPAISALDFGIQEAKTWQDHHMKPENKSDLALAAHAVYDMTKYADFVQKFNAFGEALNQAATPLNTWIPQARLQTTSYLVQKVQDSGKSTSYIDVGEFAQRLAQNSAASPELKQAASAMVASLQPMVVAKVMGTLKANALGLSVYYPVVGAAGDPTYLDLNFSKQLGASWPQFLATVAQNSGGNTSSRLMVSEVDSNLTASAVQPAKVRFSLGADQYAYDYRATLVDHQMSGQSNSVVYLGEVLLSLAQGSNNYQFQWNGTLPVLDGGVSSEGVFFGGFFEDADGTIMTGYAEYTPPGLTNSQSVVLLAELNPDGSGQIIDALDADAFEGNMGPHGIDLEPGGTLKPVYYLEKRPDQDPDHWIGDDYLSSLSVTIPATGIEGLHVLMRQVPAGIYSLEVQVTDLYENLSDPLVYYVTVNPPGPTLQIAALADGDLRISWPSAATGFIPQFTTNLSIPTWSDLSTNSMTIEGTNLVLVQSKSAAAQFYRLLKR